MIVMKKVFLLKIIILILIVINIVSFKVFYKKEEIADLCFYDEDENYVLIEKNSVSNVFTSFLYKDDNDNYLGKIYDNNNKEIGINDLIKSDKLKEYNSKISELLYLKYPKFIANVLSLDNGEKSYLFRDNELVIYFNDYDISPKVEELLYLKVNYNEIKDYLNFSVILESNYENENGYNYTNAKKSVAITFDDSPNKSKTNKILNYLADNHFHATFFVVGNKAIYNKDLLISIKNSGNEIGSHTYSHANMKKMSDDEIIDDYNKMNEIYKGLFNEDLKCLRPPYGNIKNSQINILNTSIILWSLDTNDWRYRNSDYLVKYVEENIKDGDIILFHDSYDSTVRAIEELLPILYSKGYQVMSVSELFKLKEKKLEINKIYYNAY